MKCHTGGQGLGWGIEKEVANSWRRLWTEEVQSSCMLKDVAEGEVGGRALRSNGEKTRQPETLK